jgi:DNA-directed RNA polymerase specialized sigma24 family protein
MPEDSITRWIGELKSADAGAAQQELWNRYFNRLVGLARKLLRGAAQRVEDEEDVVLNALHSFFRGAQAGRFPDLRDRTDLWPLLVKITAHKAFNQLERQHAQKRGGGRVRGESVFMDGGADSDIAGIEQVIGGEPTPDFAIAMAENCQRLLGQLDDDELREIARLKLEGYTNDEISARLGIVERTVERRLNRIRRQWAETEEAPRDDAT